MTTDSGKRGVRWLVLVTVTKWRSVLASCLFVLASVLTVTAVAHATTDTPAAHIAAAQSSESISPGPSINPPQKPDTGLSADTKNKLWIGGIALVLFALVYWRNKKRWDKWRKKAKKG